MTSSLVGSEMCIRDRVMVTSARSPWQAGSAERSGEHGRASSTEWHSSFCLLYTSDAADDM
eukprot:949871-Prorocentrum_lima.AAC.1